MQIISYLVKPSEEFRLRLSLSKYETKRNLPLREAERGVILTDMVL